MTSLKLSDMEVKFFKKDIIGKKPKKIGDRFEAFFLIGNTRFSTTKIIETETGTIYFGRIDR